MTLTRDQELWGMALWGEKQHGKNGAAFIDDKIGQLSRAKDNQGVALWQDVARRLEQLTLRRRPS